MTRWVNNFPQKCQFKSFDQWKLTLIFSLYKPELSMLRSCPNRLKFRNECYSTVNQQKTSIYALILWEEQRLNRFLKRKKVPKLYFHFWLPKKCPPLLLFNTYMVMWKYNCEPLWLRCRRMPDNSPHVNFYITRLTIISKIQVANSPPLSFVHLFIPFNVHL